MYILCKISTSNMSYMALSTKDATHLKYFHQNTETKRKTNSKQIFLANYSHVIR